MSALLIATTPAIAGRFRDLHVIMPWFIPFAAAIGFMGTKTGLAQRHLTGKRGWDKNWWMLIVLGWIPAAVWAMAQFVRQY
jgi:hypothetical protein